MCIGRIDEIINNNGDLRKVDNFALDISSAETEEEKVIAFANATRDKVCELGGSLLTPAVMPAKKEGYYDVTVRYIKGHKQYEMWVIAI